MGGQCYNSTALPQEKDPLHTEQEAGWASGPGWTGAENLTPVRPQRVAVPTEVSRSQPPYCFRHTTHSRI